jgi:hypothetical protein
MKTALRIFVMIVVAVCLFIITQLAIGFVGLTDTLIGIGCLGTGYYLAKDL